MNAGVIGGISLVASAALWSGHFAWSWFTDPARHTRRVLRRTRVSRIAELIDGELACVVGTVEVEGLPILSMAAVRPCVAYDTVVFFPDRVDTERRLVPFFVDDGTGRVRVDAAEAALCNRPIASSERFQERVIEPGAKIRIVGQVVREPVLDRAEHGYRTGGTTATLTGTNRWPLLIDVER